MRAEVSIPVAAATMAVVYAVYDLATPPMADVSTIRPGTAGDTLLGSSERSALLVSAGVAGAISLVARDPVPFWFGAGFAVVLSWWHRCERMRDPLSGKVAPRLTSSRYQVEANG